METFWVYSMRISLRRAKLNRWGNFFLTVCWGQSFVGTFEGKEICENSIGMPLLRDDNDHPFHLS